MQNNLKFKYLIIIGYIILDNNYMIHNSNDFSEDFND